MYILEIKLKQHTPLIHFLDQKNSTLRATELKPKLDKFLAKNFFQKLKSIYNNDVPVALDYKINIQALKVESIEIANGSKFPCFFAAMGKEYNEHLKYFSFTENPITITFKSYLSDLIKLIQEEVCHFFSMHNFGTRQSKGFGSFYIDESDPVYNPIHNLQYSFEVAQLNNKVGLYDFLKEENQYYSLFNSIDLFYRCLRAGINLKDKPGNTTFYFKSLMFMYAKDTANQWGEVLQWEKKTIKERFFRKDVTYNERNKTTRKDELKTGFGLSSQQLKYPDSDILNISSNKKLLLRDLLGLSSLEKWKSYNSTIVKKSINIDSITNSPSVDRFKSPILFKPILEGKKFIVYLIPEKIDSNFLNQPFEIIRNGQVSGATGNKISPISTPTRFSVEHYLDFVVDFKARISTHVQIEYQKTTEYKVLSQIFLSLTSKS